MLDAILTRRAKRFLCVGAVGFVVDGGLLFLLIWMGVDPYLGRLISFPVAVLATWQLNRHWTFAEADRTRPGRQLNRYFIVQIVGALSNYVIYAQILTAFDATLTAAGLGFVIGSLVGMLINFTGMRAFVFKP